MNYLKKLISNLSKNYKNVTQNIFHKTDKQKNLETQSIEKLSPYKSYDYTRSNLSLSEKIELEKRRRYQAYTSLDYLLSNVSYFDFFSLDSLEIVRKAKIIAQIFKKNTITSELLLLSFFNFNYNLQTSPVLEKSKLELSFILKDYGINEKELFNLVNLSQNTTSEKFLINDFFINLNPRLFSKIFNNLKNIKYSYEVNQIFELAAENALNRFKTPVISSEILFITILEAKKTKAGKILKNLLKTDIKWYTVRYALIKRLHSQEFKIRDEVIHNQHYFAYLLKSGLSEFEFANLLERECLPAGVSLYRELLLEEVLNVDIYKLLKTEIKTSIKNTSNRSYSKEILKQ